MEIVCNLHQIPTLFSSSIDLSRNLNLLGDSVHINGDNDYLHVNSSSAQSHIEIHKVQQGLH